MENVTDKGALEYKSGRVELAATGTWEIVLATPTATMKVTRDDLGDLATVLLAWMYGVNGLATANHLADLEQKRLEYEDECRAQADEAEYHYQRIERDRLAKQAGQSGQADSDHP